jgi:hypothetical protein
MLHEKEYEGNIVFNEEERSGDKIKLKTNKHQTHSLAMEKEGIRAKDIVD